MAASLRTEADCTRPGRSNQAISTGMVMLVLLTGCSRNQALDGTLEAFDAKCSIGDYPAVHSRCSTNRRLQLSPGESALPGDFWHYSPTTVGPIGTVRVREVDVMCADDQVVSVDITIEHSEEALILKDAMIAAYGVPSKESVERHQGLASTHWAYHWNGTNCRGVLQIWQPRGHEGAAGGSIYLASQRSEEIYQAGREAARGVIERSIRSTEDAL